MTVRAALRDLHLSHPGYSNPIQVKKAARKGPQTEVQERPPAGDARV
jgi:hypothetical protein